MRSLRIHVRRLRSTLRSSSLMSGCSRSQADQRGAAVEGIAADAGFNHRIRTYTKQYQTLN